VYQLVIWQECSKSGQKGHISFTTTQDFIPKVGELFSAPPLSGHVVGVTHDLHEQDFIFQSSYILFSWKKNH